MDTSFHNAICAYTVVQLHLTVLELNKPQLRADPSMWSISYDRYLLLQSLLDFHAKLASSLEFWKKEGRRVADRLNKEPV